MAEKLVTKNKQSLEVPAVLAALISAFALALNGVFVADSSLMEMLKRETDGVGADSFFVLLALLIIYGKVWSSFRSQRKWITDLLSAVFALCMLIGMSFSTQGNWSFILGNKNQMLIAAAAWLGFFVLFDVSLSLLYGWLGTWNFGVQAKDKPFPAWIEKHYFLFAFLVILAGWLPYIISYLPGCVPADGYRALNMYFGGQTFTDRHSWVLCMFMGTLMKLGRNISDSMGVFTTMAVLALIQACCYAKVCTKMKKWGAPKKFNIGVLLFFSLLPVFGAYSATVIKDSIFSGLFALYMVLYVECCIPALQKRSGRKLGVQMIVLFFVGMGVCLTRGNGFMLVALSLVFLLFLVRKKQIIAVLALLIAITGCRGVVKNVIAPAMGIVPYPSRVYYSVPMQQTARYVITYPEDVTQENKEAIHDVFSFTRIPELYNPELSDPIKGTFRTDTVTPEKMSRYFKTWLEMFKRHPGVYIEATLHNSYGYYYPFYHCKAQSPYRLYTFRNPEPDTHSDYRFIMPAALRKDVLNYANFIGQLPGLAQLCNAGAYTWMLLILAGWLAYQKRWKGILALSAPALIVVINIASPVNGLFRYAFPLVACMPVVVYWCLSYRKEKE